MDVGISHPHLAGVCLHLTSLPGAYGIGELGDEAKRFLLTLESMDMGYWQVLPTGPTGYGDSPYQSQSTFAGNELLIDIAELLRDGWLNDDEADALRDLPVTTVDFAQLIPLKRVALQRAAARFCETSSPDQRTACELFIATHDAVWLADYARYRVLKARFGERPWYDWPRDYARRDASALAELDQAEAEALHLVKVQQYFFRCQWDKLRGYAVKHGVQLLGDMPFYIAFDSADAWARPELLHLDDDLRPVLIAGVPPDYFSADGQLWGNPVYNWAAHEADNYAWWTARLEYALALTDQVRIDHFRGFEAYWTVPAGASTARDGCWQPGPGEALFDRLRETLGRLPIVAEDLGEITDAVDALRDKYGLPGMRVLQFELTEPDFDLQSFSPRNICFTGTHDNDTTRGWFLGATLDDMQRAAILELTGGTADTIHLDLFRMALQSPAQVAIAPLQDLLGLGTEARLNTPGTEQGNWRWRFLPEMLGPEQREALREMVRAAGRAVLTVNLPA